MGLLQKIFRNEVQLDAEHHKLPLNYKVECEAIVYLHVKFTI